MPKQHPPREQGMSSVAAVSFSTPLLVHVLQHQVNKNITRDYNRAVKPAQERWLGMIRDKLVNHVYNSTQEMLDDVEGIVHCARRYHGSKLSTDRNTGMDMNHRACLQNLLAKCCCLWQSMA